MPPKGKTESFDLNLTLYTKINSEINQQFKIKNHKTSRKKQWEESLRSKGGQNFYSCPKIIIQNT